MTTSTTTPAPDLRLEIVRDFHSARAHLVRARAARRQKDTPDNRAAVATAFDDLDAVLDLYLDVRPAAVTR